MLLKTPNSQSSIDKVSLRRERRGHCFIAGRAWECLKSGIANVPRPFLYKIRKERYVQGSLIEYS